MTAFASGDPASVSSLGGVLRTSAGRLADLVLDLDSGARRGPASDRPARPRTTDRARATDRTYRERELVTRTATELDRVGALLQSFTTTAVESAARVRALEPALTRYDLVVEGQLVVERSGPSRVEPGERLAERERLQELLNRVTAVRSRELARLRRELEQSSTTLAALSVRARSGT